MLKTVLITGANSGIGRVTTEAIARTGHRVYAAMRDVEGSNADAAASLKSLVSPKHLDIRILELDVTDDHSAQQAVATVLSESARLDVLINNASVMNIGVAEGFTEEQAREQMDVNFLGPFRMSRAVLPHMRERKTGLLIHVTSIVGRMVFPGAGLYCASKFALEALAESLHYELNGTGVESVIVEPGPYLERLLAGSPEPADKDRVAGYGDLANIRETFIAMFGQLFSSSASPDPHDAAKAIAHLIDLPPGQRPIRTACGLDFGSNAINELISPVQAEVLRALGMGHMVAQIPSVHVRGKK